MSYKNKSANYATFYSFADLINAFASEKSAMETGTKYLITAEGKHSATQPASLKLCVLCDCISLFSMYIV